MDILTEIDSIRSHLDNIERELKKTRREKQMRHYYNGGYNNAGDNGNFDVDDWNERIQNDP